MLIPDIFAYWSNIFSLTLKANAHTNLNNVFIAGDACAQNTFVHRRLQNQQQQQQQNKSLWQLQVWISHQNDFHQVE